VPKNPKPATTANPAQSSVPRKIRAEAAKRIKKLGMTPRLGGNDGSVAIIADLNRAQSDVLTQHFADKGYSAVFDASGQQLSLEHSGGIKLAAIYQEMKQAIGVHLDLFPKERPLPAPPHIIARPKDGLADPGDWRALENELGIIPVPTPQTNTPASGHSGGGGGGGVGGGGGGGSYYGGWSSAVEKEKSAAPIAERAGQYALRTAKRGGGETAVAFAVAAAGSYALSSLLFSQSSSVAMGAAKQGAPSWSKAAAPAQDTAATPTR
jgi:hypothetical protein